MLLRALFEGAGEGQRTEYGQAGTSPGKGMLPWFGKG